MNGQWVPVLVEHRATNNSAPNQDCVAAAHELMSALGTSDTSDLQARWVSLEAAREARAYAHQLHSGERYRAEVARHVLVLDQVLPAGRTAALVG